ncbi:MAG: hypothetical protein Q8S32_02500 [Burkholderiaceae bacterium]|nr:hypothetical protein [Burkholderiaceae bacterium]
MKRQALHRAACALALLAALGVTAAHTPDTADTAKGSAAAATVQLRCEVVYLPTRGTWVREVTLNHSHGRLRSVAIDGVPVYSFALAGAVVLTALDNERIQLDLSQPAWRSDFRGLAEGQGLCVLRP